MKQHLKILAIDTSTEACSVALLNDSKITHQYQLAPRKHAEYILTMCEQLLQQSQISLNTLTCIAFGTGPGAFTGLRIAAGVVQGIAFAHDLPVVGISSLQAIAQTIYRQFNDTHVIAAIDARMHEIYLGQYQLNTATQLMTAITKDTLVSPQHLPTTEFTQFAGGGSGWDHYHDTLKQHFNAANSTWHQHIYPNAQDIARLAAHAFEIGHFTSAELAVPTYIRNDVAQKPQIVNQETIK